MKTNKFLTGAFGAVVLVLASCSDILDLQPQTALSDATAYKTPETIELVVAGMYDAAQSGFYAGGAVRGYPFGAAHIEQGDNRGEDVVNTQAFYLITYNNTYNGVSANNDYHFQTLFALVNRINVTLAGLETATPTATLTQAQIDAYKGECRFMRALAYHELLKHFCRPYSDNPTAANGGMPYRTTAITGSAAADAAVAQARGTVDEDYANILADLNYAESVLPATRAGGLKLTRATQGAAIALKTRIYLHMRRWADVVTEANKLVPVAVSNTFPSLIGSYNLPTDPYAAFSAASSKSNPESIFSIDNDVSDNPGVNGALPSMYQTSVAPTSGRALVAISPMLWNKTWWNATDIRKTSTFVHIDVELVSGGGKGGFFTKKYTDVVGGSDNAPVIRYAEVILNLAEAIQRQNLAGAPDPRAFALYNRVRARSNPTAGSDPNYDAITDFANGTALVQAILQERRIEFLCEGLRWGDIHRLAQDGPTFNDWGGGIPRKLSATLTNFKQYYQTAANPTGDATLQAALATPGGRHDAIPYADFRFLWPIPNSEIILNPTLAAQQNPGW